MIQFVPTTESTDTNANVSDPSYGKSAGILLLKIIGGLFLIYILLTVVSYLIFRNISDRVIDSRFAETVLSMVDIDKNTTNRVRSILPESVSDSVYVEESGVRNAYSSISTDVFVTNTLVDELRTVEGLAFVVGHELSHAANRDAINQSIATLPVAITLLILGGEDLFSITEISINFFRRQQESRADKDGVDFVYEHYGHVGCVTEIFTDQAGFAENIMRRSSTHPINKERVRSLERYIENQGYPVQACTSLPFGR